MAIRPKITKDEKLRNEIIERGGKVIEDNTCESEWTGLSLRIPKKLIKEIDHFKESRVGLSRNAWILEAIQEKLNKD